MTSAAPESPEVVGARARERVALYRVAQELPPECDDAEWTAQGPASPVAAEHARAVVRYAWRRPPAVAVATPLIRQEQTPQRYVPVSLARAPFVTFEDAIREPREELLAGMRRAWAASVAGVAPAEDTELAHYPGRDPVRLDDADAYVSGAR